MGTRPDFAGASVLERPFTALLERLDDETLVFVRDRVGYGLDRTLLALCLFLVAFDTFMGNRTHPVFIAITFIEWYACALGSTLRAWWAPDDGGSVGTDGGNGGVSEDEDEE